MAVLDRSGPWLAVLLTLSANSPYWQERDSSYASFRYQVWGRWPSSGPAGTFGIAQAYREAIQDLVEEYHRAGSLPGMISHAVDVTGS